MDRPVEPDPRTGAFSATINSDFFLWGGSGASANLSHIHVFDSACGGWTAKQTAGISPPGYQYGASISDGNVMYTYGGLGKHTSGNLQAFDVTTLVWQLLSKEGPMKKHGCAIAAIKSMLVLFGGCTKSPGAIQPGSQCVKLGDRYYTNELHVYNLKTSEYISSEYILGIDLGMGFGEW